MGLLTEITAASLAGLLPILELKRFPSPVTMPAETVTTVATVLYR